MKQKLVTLIEEKVINLAKRRAVEENRPLSALIQDAFVAYLNNKVLDPKRREEAYMIFCEQPIRISREQFDAILKGNAWDA